uniref:CMP-N-acetylneuraminate-beta-1,4-galactoside alpha-2,3-sialyltransferase-like isoform X2 n=1 Tax=Myxine glutinosa TaxID=7769 RepID=UPI00358E2455
MKIEQTTDSQLGQSCCPQQDDVRMNIPQAARTPIAMLCFLLVSGFIYYSIRLNHWISWIPLNHGDYDRLGFVANLETTHNSVFEKKTDLPNISLLPCVGGETQRRMQEIFPKFLTGPRVPIFLDRTFLRNKDMRRLQPPFGFSGQELIINKVLSKTKNYELPTRIQSLKCKRCVIVGNGGILRNKSLGVKIDQYDIIVRLNSAPVLGYEHDVGTNTTLRITYPEGAMRDPRKYERDSLFVFTGFKRNDYMWLYNIVVQRKVNPTKGFWKPVATRIPRRPQDIRILNPIFINEAAFALIGLPSNNFVMGRGNIPTLGATAITMALHLCDQVAVAGFGYDLLDDDAYLHYYESTRMSAIKESWTHNIEKEKEFLRKLVDARIILDLTGRI